GKKSMMGAPNVHVAQKIWHRIVIASVLAFSWVPATLPGSAVAAPAPAVTATGANPPFSSTITAGEPYIVTGTGFTPAQKVVVHVLPSCNLVVADVNCGADAQTITPAADGTFSVKSFSSPSLSSAHYTILATTQSH